MKNEEIKKEIESLRKIISDANERIEEIQKKCKHKKCYKGNYSWRPGAIASANFCEYCGILIPGQDLFPTVDAVITTTSFDPIGINAKKDSKPEILKMIKETKKKD